MFEHFSKRTVTGFACDRLETGFGFTWTLTTALGSFLRRAEQRFGPRDMNFTVLGVEFGPDQHPRTWYPVPESRQVIVQLGDTARHDPRQALYQLAHEVVHLLAPGSERATVMEEGVAVLFAQEMSKRYNLNIVPSDDAPPAYSAAAAMAWQVYPEAIKVLRGYQPSFAKMTPKLIRTVCPSISPTMAETLCLPFQREAQTLEGAQSACLRTGSESVQ